MASGVVSGLVNADDRGWQSHRCVRAAIAGITAVIVHGIGIEDFRHLPGWLMPKR